MTTLRQQMYRAALKQAHERADWEGETMTIYRQDASDTQSIWYVRSVAEGKPENATIIEVISCSTSPTA